MRRFNIYIKRGRMTYLVIDERKKAVKELPYGSRRDPKHLAKVRETCQEIKKLRDDGYSWAAVGEIYGLGGRALRSWYARWCSDE
jgi:hypothetical protein